MQFLPVLLVAAVAATAPFEPAKRSESLLVRAVLDGDTIDVTSIGRVRLLGIDAPEMGRGLDTSAPFGREARSKLASLVLHHWVRLEYEGQKLDVYNRHLAYVLREDGVFVNAVLVREGLARVSARVPLSRLADLKDAEREAQTFRRGMWGGTPQLPSQSFRSTERTVASKRGARYTAQSDSSDGTHTASRKKRRRATP